MHPEYFRQVINGNVLIKCVDSNLFIDYATPHESLWSGAESGLRVSRRRIDYVR